MAVVSQTGGATVGVARSTLMPLAWRRSMHLVHPVEREAARLGLQRRPGEHAEGDEVDPGAPHQRDVLVPDGPVPLLGVVVPAEGEAADARAEGVHAAVAWST